MPPEQHRNWQGFRQNLVHRAVAIFGGEPQIALQEVAQIGEILLAERAGISERDPESLLEPELGADTDPQARPSGPSSL